MRRSVAVILVGVCLLILTACGGDASRVELPDDPQTFLEEVVANMQATDSFRMTVEQTGKTYPLLLSFDGVNNVEAELRRGEAQFISPNELFVNVKLRVGVPISVDIYSLDDTQWASFPSGAPYYQLPPYPDFDISRLMADGDGIEYAMTNLENIEIIGQETLIDGTTAIHIQATAPGNVVRGLLFSLIEPEDDAQVDAYINIEDNRFVRVDVTMLETLAEDDTEPAMWLLEFYDYNAPRDFAIPPELENDLPEATEEA